MINSRQESFRIQALQIADALIVWISFWIGANLRGMLIGADQSDTTAALNWILYIAVPFTPLILEKFGFYSRQRQKSSFRSITQLLQSLVIVIIVIGLYEVLAKPEEARRLALGLGTLASFVSLFIRDRATTAWMRQISSSEASKEHVLIAGAKHETQSLIEQLDSEVTDSWKVVDHFDLNSRSVEELFQLIKDESVARVILIGNNVEFGKVGAAVEACELQGIEAWISASFVRTQIARPVFDAIGDKPMLVLRSTPELSWELLCKEVIDRAGALFLIIGTFPFWIFAAIGIRLKSPGAPVFFSQMRAGRYGKPFRMWKFRTMVSNAEDLLQKTKDAHGNEMDGPVFKLHGDPRVFPFGALLRKMSIDELPQLLNVLRGNMSLVGPRPLPVYEVEAFSKITHRRRLSVKPGITCEWQAGGRNKITSFEDWVEMDLNYIDNWSLLLDCRIILKTIPAVLFGKGAK